MMDSNQFLKKNQHAVGRWLILLGLATILFSCKKYLDERPNKTQVVPSTYQDLQAILDNVLVMNRGFASIGEGAADNYYLTAADYNGLALATDKTIYTWAADGVVTNGSYAGPYQVVYYANQVMESLKDVKETDPVKVAQLRGAALFFRGYAFLEIAGAFAGPYREQTADKDMGVALRLGADFNQKSTRSTNRQTYGQLLADLRAAIPLLPLTSDFPTRPTKLAAYAALARSFLAMGQYEKAGQYADSCLASQPPLLDYNTLSQTAAIPFVRFHKETIFSATSLGVAMLVPSKAKVDSNLYRSYATADLRKAFFFKSNGNGTYAFKGNYDGSNSSPIFSGLATDEVYLIRAECYARGGETEKALGFLNDLLRTRWKKGTFVPFTASDASSALGLILQERRKELLFRGLRWTDLRRLNQEDKFKISLKRSLNGTDYMLPPGDLRYVFLIPQQVITQTGMPQNPR